MGFYLNGFLSFKEIQPLQYVSKHSSISNTVSMHSVAFLFFPLNPVTNYTLFCLPASVHTKYSRCPESNSAKTVIADLNSFNFLLSFFHPAANCWRSGITLEYVDSSFFQSPQHYETFLPHSSAHQTKFSARIADSKGPGIFYLVGEDFTVDSVVLCCESATLVAVSEVTDET